MTGASLASADLRILLAEISTARGLLRQLAEEIEDVRQRHPADVPREALALLAVDLHSYYTKLESLLERILVSFEGQVPRGESAHVGVLRVAALAVPGIRPAILGDPLREGLDELRKFRHFFRHAYALDLRADKLRSVLEPFSGTRRAVDLALETFADFIEDTVAQLEQLAR
jgi:hypothetical protein